MTLTLGSVCTGYGGLDMAIAQVLNVEPVWVADPDPGAAAILAHHWPDVPNLGDITAVDWTTVPPVDVLAAGFPCQDISYAGRGAGIKEGTRSGLWHTIAAALSVVRPRLLVLENVAAIIARRPGLDVVLADLAALGFDADWCCVRASDIGAPHRRERWFCLAWPADAARPRLQGARLLGRPSGGSGASADADHIGGDGPTAEHRPDRREVAAGDTAADPAGIGEREPADAPHPVTGGGHARPEPRGRGLQPPADAIGGQLQRRGVPGVLAGAQGHAEGSWDQRKRDGDTPADRGSVPTDPDGGGRGTEPWLVGGERAEERVPTDIAWGDYEPAIRRWERVLGRPAPHPTEPGRDDKPRLSPCFVEWLMGLLAGWVTAVPGLTRNQQLKALGNGVVPWQGAAALAELLDRISFVARDGTETAA